MAYKYKIVIIFILFVESLFGQNSIYQNHSYRPFDRYVYQSEHRFHTSIKPFNTKEVNTIVSLDTLYRRQTNKILLDMMVNHSLINRTQEDYEITFRPLFNFETSKQINDTTSGWINTRGFMLDGNIKNKVFFKTSFYETQSRFFDYRYDRIQSIGHRTVPGQGFAKPFGDDGKGLDYAFSDAYVSYVPSKIFDFQLGHGKHFIGDGYRSLLLSDNAFNYPYFKITTTFGNVKYINMWSQHLYWDNPHVSNSILPKKWNAMHYLDWAVTDWLDIGLFESIIWANEDTINGKRGFELQYLNPVIFLRPVEYSIGSPDNVLMGMNGKLTLWKKHVFYGQIIIDEFNVQEFKKKSAWWGSKYAFQLGYKTYDIAGIDKLDFQSEVNYVRPFIYSHFNEGQNYGHNNQPLAHPAGSNFIESVSFVRYNYKRWFFETKFLYMIHGQDTSDASFGNDIFKLYTTRTQEYGHEIAASNVRNTIMYQDFKISYMINPYNNANITFGITNRSQTSELIDKKQLMYYLAFRTTLNNYYYDF